jgi:hypothetical protein
VFVPDSAHGRIGSAMFASDMPRSLAYERPLPASWSIYDFRFTTEMRAGLLPVHGLSGATARTCRGLPGPAASG